MADSISKDFGYLLQSDPVFVDYLNSFLNLQVFPKKIKFDRTINIFVEADSFGNFKRIPSYNTLTSEEKLSFNKFLTKWCYERRLPLFARSSCYRAYKLCKKLIKQERVSSSITNEHTLRSRFSQFSLGQEIAVKDEGQFNESIQQNGSNAKGVEEPQMAGNTYSCRPASFSADILKERSLSRAQSLPTLPPLKSDTREERCRPTTCVSWLFRKQLSWQNLFMKYEDEELNINKHKANNEEDFEDVALEFPNVHDDNDEDVLSELRSISTKLQISIQEIKEDYLGSREKMEEFNSFLQETKGKHLISLWLLLETYKAFSVKESSTPINEGIFRMRIIREIEKKFKLYLTDKASVQILRTKEDSTQAGHLFSQMQKDVLRRLVTYWIPRYLVHYERNNAQVGNGSSDSGRGSACSLFPCISVVKSLPLLGHQVTEIAHKTPFDAMVSFEDSSWHPGCFPPDNKESTYNETFLTTKSNQLNLLFESDQEAGYPFYNFLKSIDKEDAVISMELLVELQDFSILNKSSDNRLTKIVSAWKIYNKYIAPESPKKVAIDSREVSTIHQVLLEAKDQRKQFPSVLFSTVEGTARDNLLDVWEIYSEEDLAIFVRTNIETVSSQKKSRRHIKHHRITGYSPNRWVQRHPGSTESERRRRLYTALSMAEEINASRLSNKTPVPSKSKKKKKKKKKVKFQEEERGSETESQAQKAKEVVNLSDFIDKKTIIGYYRQYVQNQEGREVLNSLMLLLDINDYTGIPIPKTAQRQQQAKFIYSTYFDKSSRRAVDLPSELLMGIPDNCPSLSILTDTKEHLLKELNKSFKAFHKAFQAYPDSSRDGQPSSAASLDFNKGNNIEGKLTHAFTSKFKKTKRKGSARMHPSKEDRASFFKAVKECSDHLTDQMHAFRKYLLWQSESETFPRLEKDLLFYLEVQKFKDTWSCMDEVSASRKAEVIIDVFIDSSTPPWIQIDIGPDLTTRIVQKAQTIATSRRGIKDSRDAAIFDEAQSIVLKELLLYWTSFKLKHTEEITDDPIPESKFEKIKTRRYEQFLKAPNVKHTVKPKMKEPSAGKSKHEMIYSYGYGIGWKKATVDFDSIKEEESARCTASRGSTSSDDNS